MFQRYTSSSVGELHLLKLDHRFSKLTWQKILVSVKIYYSAQKFVILTNTLPKYPIEFDCVGLT